MTLSVFRRMRLLWFQEVSPKWALSGENRAHISFSQGYSLAFVFFGVIVVVSRVGDGKIRWGLICGSIFSIGVVNGQWMVLNTGRPIRAWRHRG
jgi:hypothetical protein